MQVLAQPKSNAGQVAVQIFSDLLDSIGGDRLVPVWLENDEIHMDDIVWPLGRGRIFLAGVGKASVAMAQGVVSNLPGLVHEGLIVTKHGHAETVPGCVVMESGHPVPDEASLEAGAAMCDFASQCREDDLVIFLLSGGASSLIEVPAEGISLADLIDTNRILLNSGLPIREMNQIRARLSQIKGGGLGLRFGKATIVALVMNDIIGGDVQEVGSGPLSPTSLYDAPLRLSSRIEAKLSPSVLKALGASRPKAGSQETIFRSIASYWTIRQSLDAICKDRKLQVRGRYQLAGDGRKQIRDLVKKAKTLSANQCIFAHGESTLEVAGSGVGGRCQEMALIAAQLIAGSTGLAILMGGTDGTDGPTEAAGAIVDGDTLVEPRVMESALEALKLNDSNSFHKRFGSLVVTGPTGTNLNDVFLAVKA